MKQMYSSLFMAAMMCSLMNSCTLQSLDSEEVSPHLRDAAPSATIQPLALPAAGQHKVAYYVFDVTPTGQGSIYVLSIECDGGSERVDYATFGVGVVPELTLRLFVRGLGNSEDSHQCRHEASPLLPL